MVDEEARQIRDEVLRAMAEQGEDVEAFGLEAPIVPEGGSDSVALPAWDRIADAAMDVHGGESGAEATTMTPEEIERAFLAAVFDDVRAQSADGALVSPSGWLEAGLVPQHFSADDWEMIVYEYLEERAAQRAETAAAAEPAAPIRTATRTVGVPRMFRTEEPEEQEETEDMCHPERSVEDAESKDPERRDSAEPANATASLPCDDIVALVGKQSYYLYSTEHMTDAYARWSFLASEDDRMLTFVECVRDESRKYPRPMEASSLTNEPFNLTAQEVDALWQTVRDSGAYPDLDTVTASNGDVYYFSTEYLTPTYAASLAEWNSVERDMFL